MFGGFGGAILVASVDIVAVAKYNKSRFGNTSAFGNGCLLGTCQANSTQRHGNAHFAVGWQHGNLQTGVHDSKHGRSKR